MAGKMASVGRRLLRSTTAAGARNGAIVAPSPTAEAIGTGRIRGSHTCKGHHIRRRSLGSSSNAHETGNGRGSGRSSRPRRSLDRPRVYDSLTSAHRPLLPGGPEDDGQSQSEYATKGAAWYVCGPTVYDSAHLGHGRTYVLLDILRRLALRSHSGGGRSSPRPILVMNVTDVDDKIIKRSGENEKRAAELAEAKGGVQSDGAEIAGPTDPIELARFYEAEFWEDMAALNVMTPDVICRVSENVESTIVPYIERIVEGGMAYVLSEPGEKEDGKTEADEGVGSVYFDVRAFERKTGGLTRYGKLAPPAASSDLFSWDKVNTEGEETSGQPTKRDPRDFCLWKHRRRRVDESDDGKFEPESVSYDSPWGPGRPGWHVECSAMIEDLSERLEPRYGFELHAGGVDLAFPHHCNEIAQAEAYRRASDDKHKDDGPFREWIPHWVHTGHLHVKGRKMSKSLKNFITVREMLEGGGSDSGGDRSGDNEDSPAANVSSSAWSSLADDFRLWCLCLSGSYRGPATYSPERMDEAAAVRERFVRFLLEGQECLSRLESAGSPASSVRSWSDAEMAMFHRVAGDAVSCREALMDDLDGAAFLEKLMGMVDAGMVYVQGLKAEKDDAVRPAAEPLRFVLDAVRGQLELVGFSERTYDAGLTTSAATDDGGGTSMSTTALLDETVSFRSSVRHEALEAIKKKGGKAPEDAFRDILKMCDGLRDDVLPRHGIRLEDRPSGGSSWNLEDPRSLVAEIADRKARESQGARDRLTKKLDARRKELERFMRALVEPRDLFRIDEYSEWDGDGVPTMHASGEPVGPSHARKRRKAIEKHSRLRDDLSRRCGGNFSAEADSIRAKIAEIEAELDALEV
ncbi:hypothetical protein THAOC_01107 [Thalassiosira oceanica]|uniref:cysteine--tRNA ligase n=1 Tax=Thalassiosira oceanica TaxID=159749 RepID=K0TR31_THAOC|nr:hypothetical protein THAOC_01107 [Thalassiosira oceanica]|eukprot:EJK77087.1 hypothetical protein THAOC_01107 [Thalassiosira oceanica]